MSTCERGCGQAAIFNTHRCLMHQEPATNPEPNYRTFRDGGDRTGLTTTEPAAIAEHIHITHANLDNNPPDTTAAASAAIQKATVAATTHGEDTARGWLARTLERILG